MKLFHTSPKKITKINSRGMFGESLCFSSSVYSMSVGEVIVYSLEIDESEVIEAQRFFYYDDSEKLNDIISQIMDVCEVEEEEAKSFLENKSNPDDAEDGFWIQGLMGDAAKILGFKAAQSEDEQGIVYIVPMMGKESELIND